MNQLFDRILNTPDRSPAPLLLVRGVAGFVFLLEGILKFVMPDKLGVGRFVKIGIPSPEVLVAIATTKVPILPHSGFWDMAHEARLDFAMLASSCVLLTVGAGNHSIDGWLRKRLGQQPSWRMTLSPE